MLKLVLILTILVFGMAHPSINGVGYEIGSVKGYKLLKKYRSSSLYEIESQQIKDQRPIKLIQLIGNHFQVGEDYGQLLGDQVVQVYNTFMNSQFQYKWQRVVLQLFLDWQYDTFVGNQISSEFKEEIRGIQKGAREGHKIYNLEMYIQRQLVVSSYPGDFTDDVMYVLLDQFMRTKLKDNQYLLNIVQKNLVIVGKAFKEFLNKKRIHCSFFATWGSRTLGGKLYTMRNLDWQANIGLNKFKLLTVWKVKDTIPHVTTGFVGVIGALAGMSQAGLTVHQAGLDSMRSTQLGFHWALRLRYIMMYAQSLNEAKIIWKATNNTLGMNHMVASAADLATGQPVFVVETMRNYTAWFVDYDSRQNGTIFVDPKTKQKFQAGYSMKDAIFRANHAYDPLINFYRTHLPTHSSSTIHRYLAIKDSFIYYQSESTKIGLNEALNITAIAANKGGNNLYKCPESKDDGTNVMSVLFIPGDLEMLVGFEYGSGETYRTGCCGVYLKINMERWLL